MRAVLLFSALVAGGLAAAGAVGLRINTTPSMPLGLWRLTAVAAAVRHGDIVAVCPPESTIGLGVQRGYIGTGRCPTGLEPLLKPVVAVAGDHVMVSPAGVTVNGRLLPRSAPLSLDSAGRPMTAYPGGTYRVQAGTAWIVSDYNPRSFDSRYFGPVPVASIEGAASPVLVLR